MAKKKGKKSKQDARGYSTSAQIPQAAPKVVTDTKETAPASKKEEPVKKQHEANNRAVADKQPKRWLRRIEEIYDQLVDCKFSFKQIETAIEALGSTAASSKSKTNETSISLDAALDWLCLNLPTEELPALFTDQQVRDAIASQSEPSSVQVVAAPVSTQTNDRIQFDADQHFLYEPKSEENGESQEDSKPVDKSWILNKYQFEEDTAGDAEPLVSQKPQLGDEDVTEVSPEELRLQKLEREIGEFQASVNDETSNYMRSKLEIKEMKKELGRMQGQAKKLRTKVAKQQAERRAKEKVEQSNGKAKIEIEGDEDFGGGLGMFEEPDEDAAVVSKPVPDDPPKAENQVEDTTDPFRLRSSSASIPQGWTGTTPKAQLEEWCRKQKLARPTFSKVLHTSNGCRVGIKGKSTFSFQQDGPFYDFADAQQFVATHALYQLVPDLPLHRIFPPVFRDKWKSWLDQVESAKLIQKQEERGTKDEIINRLIKFIPDKVLAGIDSVLPETDSRKLAADRRESLGSRGNSGAARGDGGNRSQLGFDLKAEFEKRRQSKIYRDMLDVRTGLPMINYREELLQTIDENAVTVLCAETGAGKTTQGPQFLLEDSLSSGRAHQTSILCTQPRRISAMSVAERVADEMCVTLGDLVGYQIRGNAVKSQRTRLLFCTTGVVLRRLQEDPILHGVTTVVVDEVHERSWQIDFLLIALRRLLHTTRPDLKVVLMSATLDAELFCSFFGGAPLVNVPGRTFPVTNYFLEDLLDATGHTVEEDSQYALRERGHRFNTESLWVTSQGGEKRREVVDLDSQTDVSTVSGNYTGYNITTQRSMDRVDEKSLNYDLVEDVLLLLSESGNDILLPPSGNFTTHGAILIFLPGMSEIRTLSNRLIGSRLFGDKKSFDVIPLHSTLSQQDQKRAFAKMRPGCRKIILATNIAETSVTIPDVICVIDSGLVREVRQDKRFATSKLVLDWCSKASIKQRAGRAGRVQEGICCRLFSSRTSKLFMKDQTTPELQRVPLEEVCLSILAGNLSNRCVDFLMQAPQPPPLDSVQLALNLLKEVGAVEVLDDENGREVLTAMGQHMAKIPLHVRLSKMLIFAALFHCLDPVLTIVASLSGKPPFVTVTVNDSAAQTKAAHTKFRHLNSDFISLVNMWQAFSEERKSSRDNARGFCRRNYISWNTMMEISDMRRQNLELLFQIGFLGGDKKILQACNNLEKSLFNKNGKNEGVIHAVCCAGLYPNVANAVKEHLDDPPILKHKQERLYFHSSSVNNGKKKLPSEWIVFHEKFATGRTTVSATCPIESPSLTLLLFGGSIVVKHRERRVVVDDWIELNMAAQSALLTREMSRKLDTHLLSLIERPNESADTSVMQDIVAVLSKDGAAPR